LPLPVSPAAKREQLPLAERVALWQAEAATVGLNTAAFADVLDRPAATPNSLADEPADRAVLAGLTGRRPPSAGSSCCGPGLLPWPR